MDLETLLKYSGMEKDVSESKMSDLDIEAQENSREDFVDMHKGTLGSAEEAGKFWDDSKESRESNESVETEAVGTAADPIMDLCDDVGCDPDHPIFQELVRYLDVDQIADFVSDYRRNHDMPNGMDETTEVVEEPVAEDNKEADVQEAEVEEADVQEADVQEADVQEAEVEEADVQEADVQETVEVAVDDLASLMSLAGLQADTQATKALDEYSNSPDEDYMDADMQLNKLSGGLNGPKAHTRKEGPGDNPLAAKLADQLQALMSK